MTSAALYGLLAWALLVGALASLAPGGRRLPVALGIAGVALIPFFAGESLAAGLHGALAAPSATLLQLGLRRLFLAGRPAPLGSAAAATIAATALLLYPPALGLGPFDPYGLGYRPLPLLLTLLPLAAWLAWRGRQTWLVILGFDLLAYGSGFFDNLWDALMDPILALLAGIAVLKRLAYFRRPRPDR